MADALEPRIDLLLTELRLPSIRTGFRKIAKEVSSAGGDYFAYLHALLDEEARDRFARRIQRRLKDARFRQTKEIGQLEAESLPKGIRLEFLHELARGDYLSDATNILAIGNSGTGKTHISIGLGVAACRQGRKVRFYTATELVCELEEAQEKRTLHRYLRRFAALDLVIIDELGYMPISEPAAQLLFQALSERHERGSVIINSNLPFGDWGQIFQSDRLTVALLDRLTHRAQILEMNGDSYRLAAASRRTQRAEEA